MKRSAGILLAICILFACVAPATAEMTLTPIPDMTVPFEADPANLQAPALEGFFKFDVTVGDKTRAAYIYIPDDTVIKRGTVMIAPPDGANSLTFLEESGWKALADADQFVPVLLEAENGTWAADEDAYLKAVLAVLKANTYYRHGGRGAYYLIGYEEGAAMMSREAVANTDQYAGLALLGGTATAERQGENETGKPLPLPVWLVTAKDAAANADYAAYWAQVNHCGTKDVYSNQFADEIYQPISYLAATNQMTEQEVSKVMVTYGGKDIYGDPDFLAYLWRDFLFRVQCFPAYGNTRVLRAWAFPEEVGNEYVTLDMDGKTREFYVYVPTDVKEGKESGVPLVFVFHGLGGGGEEFAVRSGWIKLAEEKNCIVVHPSGSRASNYITTNTWGGEDLAFVKAIREYMIANYSVDQTRVYLTGTSMGSIFSIMCMAQMPNLFAAAATSDFVYDMTAFSPNEELPIALMTGVGTLDSYMNTADLLATPSLTKLQGYLATRLGLTAFDAAKTYQNGTWKYYVWENAQGAPLYTLETSIGKVHADMPDETYMFYDYMTKFARAEDGTLYYMGEKVELPSM